MKAPFSPVVRRLILLALVTSPACGVTSYLGYRISPDDPPGESGTTIVEGLEAPVRVYLDESGIPHIEALNQTDLARAVGFMHGRDRFFEMDMMRRFARGRLSELVGEQNMFDQTTVQLDFAMRGWGFEQDADEDERTMDDETRDLLNAYCDGVNLAVSYYLPIEYRLLEVDPEPWRPRDSFAVGRLTSWGITHNWRQELSRLVLAVSVGIDRAEALYPSEHWPGGVSVALQDDPHELPPAIHPAVREMIPDNGFDLDSEQPPEDGLGPVAFALAMEGASNGWAVGGNRTRSGKPVLASDPHLSHFVPSVFYQQHLMLPDLDVIGVTVPGIPFVLIGHNRNVAWAVTSAVADVVDLYFEKSGETPWTVVGPEGEEELEVIPVVIGVRDGSEVQQLVMPLRKTRRGPLVNDLYPGLLPDQAPLISVHWETGSAAPSMLGLSRANHANTVQELRDALATMTTPVNTIVAAKPIQKILQ